jgi:hypothetical protein
LRIVEAATTASLAMPAKLVLCPIDSAATLAISSSVRREHCALRLRPVEPRHDKAACDVAARPATSPRGRHLAHGPAAAPRNALAPAAVTLRATGP